MNDPALAELQIYVPSTLDPESRKVFFDGLTIGLKNRRAQKLDSEIDIIEDLKAEIVGSQDVHLHPVLVEGIEAGIELCIQAERNASEIHKSVAAPIPIVWLRRYFSSFAGTAKVLTDLSSFELKLLERAYLDRYGVPLISEIRSAFFANRAVKLVGLLNLPRSLNLQSKERQRDAPLRYTAEELHEALETGSPWVGKFFVERSEAERKLLVENYALRFRPLETEIAERFHGFEKEIILDLIAFGRVAWSKLLYFCVVGVGTDEDGLRELFEQISPEELTVAREEFRDIWKVRAPWYEKPFPNLFGELERRIWLETGGDSWFDLKEYFLPAKKNTHSIHEKLLDLYRHERSGFLIKHLDFFSHSGLMMNRDAQLLRQFHNRYGSSLEVDKAVLIRFNALVRYAELDCELFRAVKHHMGNHLTNVVATCAVAGAVFAMTSQKLTLLTVMVCTGLVSVACRLTLKTLLKGRGYHRGEIAADVFFGTFDGLTLFATHLFRQALIQFGMRTFTKLGVTTGVSRLSRTMGSRRSRDWGIAFRGLAGKASKTRSPLSSL